MKNKKLLIVPLALLTISFSYAQVNIDRTIQDLRAYIQKIIFTNTGAPNGNETVVVDGSNGTAVFKNSAGTTGVFIDGTNSGKLIVGDDKNKKNPAGTNNPNIKFETVKGITTPAGGKNGGIEWTDNIFGGGGDLGWIKYYSESVPDAWGYLSADGGGKENTVLEIGVTNDPADNPDIGDKIRLQAPGVDFVTWDYTRPITDMIVPKIKIRPDSTQINNTLNVSGATNLQGPSHLMGKTIIDDLDVGFLNVLKKATFAGPTYMSGDTYIDNLIGKTASINDLKVNNSTTLNGTLKTSGPNYFSGNSYFDNLFATNANIKNLIANLANITTLTSQDLTTNTLKVLTSSVFNGNTIFNNGFTSYGPNTLKGNTTIEGLNVSGPTNIAGNTTFNGGNVNFGPTTVVSFNSPTPTVFNYDVFFKKNIAVDGTSTFNGPAIFKNGLTVNQINGFFQGACPAGQYVTSINSNGTYNCSKPSPCPYTIYIPIVKDTFVSVDSGFGDSTYCPSGDGRVQTAWRTAGMQQVRTCQNRVYYAICAPYMQ